MTDDPRKDEELEAADEAAAEVESDEAKVEDAETPEVPAAESAGGPDRGARRRRRGRRGRGRVRRGQGRGRARRRRGARGEAQALRRRSQPAAEEAAPDADDEEAPAEQAAPARRRDRRRAADPGVVVRAQARYVRTSARKARLVCDHIRGKDVEEARAILAFTPRGAAKAGASCWSRRWPTPSTTTSWWARTCAIAAVYADEGPTLKRFRPRAMGRATRIRKRTCHLTITLTPKG